MTNPYRRWTRLCMYAALGLLLLSLAVTPLGRTVALWSWVMGGSLAFSALLMAMISWFYAKKADKHLAAFESGNYLAHWRYEPEEWRAFAEGEWARTQKKARWAPLWGLLTGGLVGLVLIPTTLSATWLVVIALLVTTAGWGVGQVMLSTGHKANERARLGGAEAYIGAEAALINGRYFHWTGMGVSLSGLELGPGNPSVLEFTVRAGRGRNASYHTHRIPVPAGRSGEAEKILAALGRARTIALAFVCAVLFPLGAASPQDAPAREVQAGQGACKLGARVTDNQNRSGVVVAARGPDCRVRYADGSINYYLAWMLKAAGGEGARSTRSDALRVGSYHCVAAGGVAGTLRLVIRSATKYAGGNGKIGGYTFDPKTRKIVFDSGPWAGYYGAQLGPEKIGLSSRPGNFYNTVCDLK